jgi:hypothetical protein
MPRKMARSAPRPPFGLPDAPVAVRTSRLSCGKAGKARIFTPVWDSSGESRYTELLCRLVTLVRDGSIDKTGLPTSHPLIRFAQTPEDVNCALSLDDAVIWGALSLMAESTDKCLSNFAQRLRDRNLYKSIDVRARIAHEKGDAAAASAEADRVCADVRTELANLPNADDGSAPRILMDQESRSPYKRITESKGPLDQINIRTHGGHLMDLAKRSKVVAELETYKLFRVYHANEDDGATKTINEIIDARITSWQQ